MLDIAEAIEDILTTPDYPSCTCDICRDMCKRSCWPTPEEAERLIDAGYAHKLMRDWWDRDDRLPYTEILCPASLGREGGVAPSWVMDPCVFWNGGLCDLHVPGLKPVEGRVTGCKGEWGKIHGQVAATWATAKGREVVKRWMRMMEI